MSCRLHVFEFELTFDYFRQIEYCKYELLNSDFLESAISSLNELPQLKQVREIVCLGIGRISDCSIAKHQLALISLLARHFGIETIKFFDPVLSASEKQLIEELNYKVLTENKEGKYEAAHPTLFYLPHCPKQITNNLLYANWNSEKIQNLLLICNSFQTIIDTTPERFLRPNGHYILEINPFASEKEIENIFKFPDIFNDLSIVTFASETLEQAPAELWENNPVPNYAEDDIELVTNGSN